MRPPESPLIAAVNVPGSLISAATIDTELPPAPSLRYTVYPVGDSDAADAGATHCSSICVDVCAVALTLLGPANAVPLDTIGVLPKPAEVRDAVLALAEEDHLTAR